jgi:hypothetical protein
MWVQKQNKKNNIISLESGVIIEVRCADGPHLTDVQKRGK